MDNFQDKARLRTKKKTDFGLTGMKTDKRLEKEVLLRVGVPVASYVFKTRHWL
jgi:hypothetical protein